MATTPDTKGDTMTTQYVFESRYQGPQRVAARHMIRDLTDSGEKWRHKWNRTLWDYADDITDNHKRAVTYACRVQIQKEPIDIRFGGDTERGQLWIVTTI